MVCLGRLYPFKYFKGCQKTASLPQILLGPLLNALSHLSLEDLDNLLFIMSFVFCKLSNRLEIFPTDINQSKTTKTSLLVMMSKSKNALCCEFTCFLHLLFSEL